MEDGGRFQETVLLPKGDPGAPLSDAELEDKFRANCAGVLGAARTERLRAAILRLAEAGTVGEMVALAAGRG
jgi:2-methylcitrate dehydratase PrpD